MSTDKNFILKQSVIYILRPLARLLVACGLTYKDFINLAEPLFRDTTTTAEDIPAFSALGTSPGAGVVAEWTTNPSYLNENDVPIPLPYSAFSKLVANLSPNADPRALLDDLLQTGMAVIDQADNVTLKTGAYLPPQDSHEKYAFFSRTVGSHIAAASKNLMNTPAPFFDRCAYNGSIDAAHVKRLKELLEKEGMTLLKNAYSITESPGQSSDAKQRATIGIYMYVDDEN